ncbi:hypothetical protein HDK90DRAFT_95600 [Phyllosticta capitalensis]|uniref:Uncharacterized protein n=1 Tax=Phyllosticta capitalensis TaxID=121624 RepID=A0ABR1YBX8_9PEZI
MQTFPSNGKTTVDSRKTRERADSTKRTRRRLVADTSKRPVASKERKIGRVGKGLILTTLRTSALATPDICTCAFSRPVALTFRMTSTDGCRGIKPAQGAGRNASTESSCTQGPLQKWYHALRTPCDNPRMSTLTVSLSLVEVKPTLCACEHQSVSIPVFYFQFASPSSHMSLLSIQGLWPPSCSFFRGEKPVLPGKTEQRSRGRKRGRKKVNWHTSPWRHRFCCPLIGKQIGATDLSSMKRQQRGAEERVDLSHISPTANHSQVLIEQPATHERRLPYDPGDSHAHSFAQMARPCCKISRRRMCKSITTALSSGQRIKSAFRTSKINVSASTCMYHKAVEEFRPSSQAAMCGKIRPTLVGTCHQKGPTQSFRSEGKVQAPLTMSATTSGVPLPIEGMLDVGVGANRAQTRSISFSFRAPGEQIFAV